MMAIRTASCPIIADSSSPYDNINWVNGITCNKIFKTLTPFEREILIMSYLDKKKNSEIADICGVCRATINRKKQATIETLKVVNSDIIKK